MNFLRAMWKKFRDTREKRLIRDIYYLERQIRYHVDEAAQLERRQELLLEIEGNSIVFNKKTYLEYDIQEHKEKIKTLEFTVSQKRSKLRNLTSACN